MFFLTFLQAQLAPPVASVASVVTTAHAPVLQHQQHQHQLLPQQQQQQQQITTINGQHVNSKYFNSHNHKHF